MITLQNSKLTEKENTFKNSYEKLKDNEQFMYEGFACEKINDKYFFAEDAYGRYIIFDVFENWGSIGSYGVTEYSTKEEVYNRVQELNGKREHTYTPYFTIKEKLLFITIKEKIKEKITNFVKIEKLKRSFFILKNPIQNVFRISLFNGGLHFEDENGEELFCNEDFNLVDFYEEFEKIYRIKK